MTEYYCECCENLLTEREIRVIYDDKSDEIYLICRYCGSECREWDGGDEEYEEEEENK